MAAAAYRAADMLASSVWILAKALGEPSTRSPLRLPFKSDFVESIDRTWKLLRLPHPREAHPAFDAVIERRTEWQLAHAQKAAQIAAIAIRHAAFDELLCELLTVSMGMSPARLVARLGDRKITWREVHAKDPVEVDRMVIAAALAKMERESLTEKWNLIATLEPPLPDSKEQELYSRGEIVEFDTLRREAVHRFSLTQSVERIDTLLQLVGGIATILPFRLAHNHNFVMATEHAPTTDDPFFGDSSWLAPFLP